MTRKLFWTDPYLARLDTRVGEVAGDLVTLEETIFFAFSGGQESDAGTIAGHPVMEARKAGQEILYALPGGHGLAEGDPVTVEIDWPRRYRLMRLHFAAELVLELAYRAMPGVQKIGAHIAADKARIDFAWQRNLTDMLPRFTAESTAIVDADLPIASRFSDEAAGRRYWEVAGFAQVPCGGTHLQRTSEVGTIELKRRNVGRYKERIEVYVA